MEISGEAIAGFAALLAVGLWETWRPHAVSDAAFGWRWANNILVYVVGAYSVGWLAAAIAGSSWRTGLPISESLPLAAVSLAVGVVILDLERYWLHRLLHFVPILWRCHALHHSDRELDVSTGYRHHPFEVAVAAVVLPLSAASLGIPGSVIIAYGGLDAVATAFQHGNIKVPQRLQRILAPVIVTPGMHRIHHSIERSEADTNFGQIFSIWDRLFATYTPPKLDGSRIEFGVAEFTQPADQRLTAMMLTPFLVGTRSVQRVG